MKVNVHAVNFTADRKLVDFIQERLGKLEKFYDKGNQAAGTRVRKGMQDLKNLAQEIRTEVQEKKNAG